MSEVKNKRHSNSPQRPQVPRPSDVSKAKPSSGKGRHLFGLFFMASYLLFFYGVFILFLGNCESFIPKSFRKEVCGNMNPALAPIRPFLDITKHWNSMLKSRLDLAIKISTLSFTAPCAAILAFCSFNVPSGFVKDLGLIHAAVMGLTMAHVDMRVYDSMQDAPSAASAMGGLSSVQVAAIVLGFFTMFPVAVIYSLVKAPSRQQSGFLVGLFNMTVRLALVAWLLASVMAVYEFTIKNVDAYRKFPSVADHTAVLWENSGPIREKAVQAGQQYGASLYTVIENLGHKVMALFSKTAA